ncbi:MAG TPA: 2-amino-4-hydroxy-6-hydroxymethyldihydropteridine diphosphokinase [Cyclobacteriaceae bacterium]
MPPIIKPGKQSGKTESDGIFLLLGSNLGNPAANLSHALGEIESKLGTISATSSRYRTAPWGNTDQPYFLNQVIQISTSFDPHELLDGVNAIEVQMGRVRNVKWDARIIDIDILFYGGQIIHNARLDIPHPGIPFRRFTLEPLAEMIPNFVHPELQKTVSALLAECPDHSEVERLN